MKTVGQSERTTGIGNLFLPPYRMTENSYQTFLSSDMVSDDRSLMLLWKYSSRECYVNFFGRKSIEACFGRSDDSFPMTWTGFLSQSVHPDDRKSLQEHLDQICRQTLATRQPVVFQAELRLKLFGQDHWVPFSASASSMPDGMGHVEIGGNFFQGRFLPASLPKSTLEVDGTLDWQDRNILDAIPFGCILWDRNHRCIACNLETARLFGLPDGEKVLECFEHLSPPLQPDGRPSMETVRATIDKAFETGNVSLEWLHQDLSGNPIPTEMICVRVWRDGRDCVAAYMRDLRELRKTEIERDRERNLLLEIINTSPVCFTFLVDGVVRVVTPFMTNFIGIKSGDRLRDFATSATAYDRLRSELEKHQEVHWQPISIRTAYGKTKDMLANIAYLDYNGEQGTMVWLIDVTDIRRVEAELRQARDSAEESARAKGEFLANMSHEIRTPMNAILGMTHLALRTDLTPQQKKYLESSEHSAKLLLRIINDILDFSKIEAGKMLMEYHEFAMKDVVSDLRSIVNEPIRDKGLIFNVDLADDLPKELMGDSVRLRQVLVNLLTNAIKFTDSGGTIHLSIRCDEQDMLSAKLLFMISDTGIGMTPHQVAALFRPFTQADTSTTRKYGGTGLGLAISKKIVELMKGEIWCESQVDKGTTFSFTAQFGMPLEGEIETDEIRTDVLLLGDNHETLKEIRNYLELLKCKTVAQCETLEEFDRFLQADRMEEVDFIVFDFDEIQHHGKPMIRGLLAKYHKDLPPMYFTEHRGLDRLLEEAGLPKPESPIHKPIVVSELFDILVKLTEWKKKQRTKARQQAALVDNETTDDANASKYGIPDDMRGARILLAEDNKINQMVATELLATEGFVVDVANNGREAIEMLDTHQNEGDGQYALVLMDIQMPVMDGLEATREIRANERFKNLPILAMTAHAISGDRELSLEAGMNDHITKPIDPTSLFQTLVKWIKRTAAGRATGLPKGVSTDL